MPSTGRRWRPPSTWARRSAPAQGLEVIGRNPACRNDAVDLLQELRRVCPQCVLAPCGETQPGRRSGRRHKPGAAQHAPLLQPHLVVAASQAIRCARRRPLPRLARPPCLTTAADPACRSEAILPPAWKTFNAGTAGAGTFPGQYASSREQTARMLVSLTLNNPSYGDTHSNCLGRHYHQRMAEKWQHIDSSGNL